VIKGRREREVGDRSLIPRSDHHTKRRTTGYCFLLERKCKIMSRNPNHKCCSSGNANHKCSSSRNVKSRAEMYIIFVAREESKIIFVAREEMQNHISAQSRNIFCSRDKTVTQKQLEREDQSCSYLETLLENLLLILGLTAPQLANVISMTFAKWK